MDYINLTEKTEFCRNILYMLTVTNMAMVENFCVSVDKLTYYSVH
jgi:hypothetical protein